MKDLLSILPGIAILGAVLYPFQVAVWFVIAKSAKQAKAIRERVLVFGAFSVIAIFCLNLVSSISMNDLSAARLIFPPVFVALIFGVAIVALQTVKRFRYKNEN